MGTGSKDCERITKFGTRRGHPRPQERWFADPSLRTSRIQGKDYSNVVPLSVRDRTKARREAFWLLVGWVAVVSFCYLAITR
jgi:hypothetical protein